VAGALHKRHGHQVVLVVYSMLFALVLAEIALQLVLPRTRGDVPWQPGLHTADAADTMTGISGTIRFSINSLGLRGPEVNLDEMDLRILCVGGSSTECLHVDDPLSWPWRLQDMLAARLDRVVFVGNAGKSGHFTLNHRYLLEKYPRVPEFDWVIVKCGINDCGRVLRDDYEQRRREVPYRTLAPSFGNNVYYRCLKVTQLSSIFVSTRSGEEVEDLGGAWNRRARRNRRMALEKRVIDAPPPALQQAVDRYRSDLRSIIETCSDQGVKLMMITQPTLWTRDLPADLEALLTQHTPHGAHTPAALEQVISAFNRAMIEVCRQEQVPCLDLDPLLPKDTSVFYDDAHFNEAGCERVATIVCNRFIVELEKRR
jgi:hypothetical protein